MNSRDHEQYAFKRGHFPEELTDKTCMKQHFPVKTEAFSELKFGRSRTERLLGAPLLHYSFSPTAADIVFLLW
jgi:hypothetical protein